jgi:hypothetical protein
LLVMAVPAVLSIVALVTNPSLGKTIRRVVVNNGFALSLDPRDIRI